MKLKIIGLFVFLFSLNPWIYGNNNPEVVMRIEGNKQEIAVMIPEIAGPVQLFSANRQIEKIVRMNRAKQ